MKLLTALRSYYRPCLFVLAVLLGAGPSALRAQTVYDQYMDGELFVQLAEGERWPSFDHREAASEADLPARLPEAFRELAQAHEITRLEQASIFPELSAWHKLSFRDAEAVDELVRKLNALPEIKLAERRPLMRKVEIMATPNDLQGSQWHLPRIDAEDAWDVAKGDKNIVIAIVDDAMKITHEDLAPNVWVNPGEVAGNGVDDDGNGFVDDVNGYDVADGDNNPSPPASASNSDFTHGTHVGGIAGAATDNGKGVAGISWNVSLMGVKGKPDSESGPGLPNVFPEGVEYAMKAGADIISMSFGGPGSSQFAQNVYDNAHNQGITLIAAAGNDNTNQQFFPAAYNHVIAVGATNSQDQKASFSNFGNYIDVMAPGVQILSTLAGSNSSYGNLSGTSMACPLVSGLAGLMLSQTPSLTPDALEQCLKTGADDISAQNPNFSGDLGAGRINALNALNCSNPQPKDNDAGISQINAPNAVLCDGQGVRPNVEIFNFGQNTLTEVDVYVSFNGQSPFGYNVSGLNIPTGGSDTINLSPFNFPVGSHIMKAWTGQPNTQTDERNSNDTLVKALTVLPAAQTPPFSDDFESQSFQTNNWTILNEDEDFTWEITNTAGNPNGGSNSAFVELYEYRSVGQLDELIMPPMDLTNYTDAQLSFKHAYRRINSSFEEDSLLVKISTDCGQSWTDIHEFAGGGGEDFATNFTIGFTNFVPQAADDWCGPPPNDPRVGDCQSLDLTPFVGQEVVIKFVMNNGFGNNIFLDDVNLTGTQGPTSRLPASLKGQLRLAPNPSEGKVFVHADQSLNLPPELSYTVHDALGRRVKAGTLRSNGAGRYPLQLREQSGGLYHLRLQTPQGAATFRLLLQR